MSWNLKLLLYVSHRAQHIRLLMEHSLRHHSIDSIHSGVNPAALPLPMVRCYSIRLPRRVASWVNYSSRRTESSSEHFASALSLLKADALWWENKRCSDSNPWPMDPTASVLPTTPQRLISPHTEKMRSTYPYLFQRHCFISGVHCVTVILA